MKYSWYRTTINASDVQYLWLSLLLIAHAHSSVVVATAAVIYACGTQSCNRSETAIPEHSRCAYNTSVLLKWPDELVGTCQGEVPT